MAHQFSFHEKINPKLHMEAVLYLHSLKGNDMQYSHHNKAQDAAHEATIRIARPRKHPREDVEHEQVMSWARIQKFRGGKVATFIHHSPNGGKRSASEAARFKRMGTQAGFPDLFIYVPCGGYHGLFIELKAHDGKLSPMQKIMLAKLEEEGYCCKVCYGFEQAKLEICKYLGLGEG